MPPPCRHIPITGTALVLGMTPELRRLALQRYRWVVSVDINPQAIALYRDWVDPADRPRERIIQADWMELPYLVDQPVQAVFGDGVFGNLPAPAAYRRLLHRIALVLATDGSFVTRHALIPRGFDPAAYRAEVLLQQFRRGEIDEAEFGFGMRLVGHYESCYDQDTFLLDNACLFRKCEEAHRHGALSEASTRPFAVTTSPAKTAYCRRRAGKNYSMSAAIDLRPSHAGADPGTFITWFIPACSTVKRPNINAPVLHASIKLP